MSAVGYAQLPKWVINPVNDTIFVKVDDCLLQSMADGQSALWSMDGKMLYNTDNTILPFKDDVATVLSKDKTRIVGVVDLTGKFISLPNLPIAYGNPYFEDGFLISEEESGFVYYRKDGSKANFPAVIESYPFHRGYAPYLTYENMEKMKDPHYGYFKANEQAMSYSIVSNGSTKPVEEKDIDFLSSIGANGKGVAVIKNKLYWFVPETETFEPFLWGNEESLKKRHLNLDGNYEQYFLNLPKDTIEIRAKYGKDQYAMLLFDKELVPARFEFADDVLTFKTPDAEDFKYSTELSPLGNGPFGLNYKAEQAIPEQFEAIGLMYGKRALVKADGKWGIIEILPDISYSLKLNKGEDIAFRHQKFETQIRLDLPAQISAKEARIDIPEETGCLIDKTSRETKDTESGNFVTYDCVLNIPESLPDTITTITYSPIQVSYEGISLFDKPISVKAWHLKYYNVDPIDTETTISDGVASFTININAQKNVGENDYPFDVKIAADSVIVEYEKISETRYKCTVANLKEGENNLNILVTEKGCPASVFHFEITYKKPVPKKKQKEEVIIRKKSSEVKKLEPRLKI